MTNSQRLATVRARLKQWLHETTSGPEHGENGEAAAPDHPATPEITRESILIRNDFFCGRRFQTAHHYAIWFIEEDELKIFRENGELLCVLRGDELNVTPADAPHVIRMPAAAEVESANSDARRAA